MDESQNSFYRVRKSYPFKNGIDLLIFRLKEGNHWLEIKKGTTKRPIMPSGIMKIPAGYSYRGEWSV